MYFRLYKDTAGYWRWHLKSANHEIIAQGEAYYSKEGCKNAVSLVKASYGAPVYE